MAALGQSEFSGGGWVDGKGQVNNFQNGFSGNGHIPASLRGDMIVVFVGNMGNNYFAVIAIV